MTSNVKGNAHLVTSYWESNNTIISLRFQNAKRYITSYLKVAFYSNVSGLVL